MFEIMKCRMNLYGLNIRMYFRSNAIYKQIIIKSSDPLRAKKTFIRKKMGHTLVSAI